MISLDHALKNVYYYSPSHASVAQCMQQAAELLSGPLSQQPELTLKFVSGQVVLGDQRLFRPQHSPGTLIAACTRRGLESITLLRGLSSGELGVLMEVLSTGANELRRYGGGFEALRDRQLRHLRADRLGTQTLEAEGEGGGVSALNPGELYASCLDVVRESMHSALVGQMVDAQAADQSAGQLVERIISDPRTMMALTCVKGYDEYTFVHSLHICLLTVGLGHYMGLTPAELRELGTCALLHDVGKALVPLEVLRKADRPTPQEWELLQRHPVDGARILKDCDDLTPLAAVVAFEHHLRVDLQGYPKVHRAWELCPYSKMVAVCDVYDAITTPRSYRRALDPVDAVKLMVEEPEGHFDPMLLRWLVEMLGAYPPGTCVVLEGGALGVVCKPNPHDPGRPTVLIVAEPDGRRLEQPYEAVPGLTPDLGAIRQQVEAAETGIDVATLIQNWAAENA